MAFDDRKILRTKAVSTDCAAIWRPAFVHDIDYVNCSHDPRSAPYEATEFNQIVVDYIASMTDDYLIDLHGCLFPDGSCKVEYLGYFQNEERGNTHV